MSFRSLGVVLLALGLLFASPPLLAAPSGKDVAAAKKADKQGRKLEKKKDLEGAKQAYEEAIGLNDTPATRVRLAGVDEKLGNLMEAADHLRVALDAKKKLSFNQRIKAQRQLKSIEKRIPVLKLELPFSFSGKVHIDDRELDVGELGAPIKLNPGSHKIKAEAEGFQTYKESIELAEKDEKNLTVLMTELPKEAPPPEPKPEPKKSGDKTLAYVALGVGVVGLAVGGYMGLKARSTKSELDDACKSGVCTEAQRDLYDRGKSQANVSTIGFIVGAVGIGAGTVLLLTGGGDKEGKVEARRVTPYVGLGHAGFTGQF